MNVPEDVRSEQAAPPPPTEPKAEPEHPAIRFAQLLLDPRGLHVLMLAGSGLLALGVVLWLAVMGVFDEPLYAALGLGTANFALLGGGLWLAAKTSHRMAGRATAMLACLLLPLNLWFYDAQGLVTLAQGGNLWLPALACCVVYAGVARLLKDSLFVYAFAAGVAMTGLLFLAGGDAAHFWEVLAPSTLLVALGVGCIHVERLFPEKAASEANQAFTRSDFGLAFFRAGHTLLASGLGVLLAGRLAGRFYEAVFANLEWFDRPDVATVLNAQLAAFCLALAGGYAYAYSRFVGGHRRYALFSLLALTWSGLIGLDLLGVPFTEVLVVGLLGAVALASRLAEGLFESSETDMPAASRYSLNVAGRVAGMAGVALVLLQLLRGVWATYLGVLGFDFTWGYVAAASLVLVAEALAARRSDAGEQRWVTSVLALVAVVAGVVSVAPVVAGWSVAWHMAAMTVVPAGLFAATLLVAKNAEDRATGFMAVETAGGLLVALLAPSAVLNPTVGVLVATMVLLLVFGWLTLVAGRRTAGGMAALCAVAACWEATVVYNVGANLPLLLLTVASVALVAVERMGWAKGVGGVGRAGVCLAALAGGLLAGNRMLAGEADLNLLGLLAAQAALTAVSAAFSRREEGRHGLLGLAVAQVAMSGVVLNLLSVLTFAQRMEVFLTAVGAGLVVAGLVGWRREASGSSDGDPTFTDVNLWLGSLLMTAPLSLGLLGVRLDGGSSGWVVLHEVGVLVAGLSLVAVGVMCRLRATTLTGAAALVLYVASLVTLLHVPEQLQTVAFALMAGGGALFGAAVLLSVYRDRLMQLPERLKEGRGVFAVLKWR